MTTSRQRVLGSDGTGTAIQLGENAVVDEGVVLGYLPASGEQTPLVVGPNARIRRGSAIYAGTSIGSGLETGHNVVIRERNSIGDNLRIWSNSIIDYGCLIGDNVKIHNNVYISQFCTIADDAFIGPGVTLANDSCPGCPDALACMQGPIIGKGAQIGANACVLPRVVVGEQAVIGAGSVVTRDIPAGSVAYGNPARVHGLIYDVKCKTGRREKPYSQ